MHTVIIAKNEQIKWVNNYRVFFEPFLKDEIEFCEWNPKGEKIGEIIPDIYRCIGGRREWRAIIVYDDPDGKKRINPFDVVGKSEDEKSDDAQMSETDNVKAKKENGSIFDNYPYADEQVKKLVGENFLTELYEQGVDLREKYERAINQPLTRLATILCPLPLDAYGPIEEVKLDLESVRDGFRENRAKEAESPEGVNSEAVVKKKEEDEINSLTGERFGANKANIIDLREQFMLNSYRDTAKHKKLLREKFLNGDPLAEEIPGEELSNGNRLNAELPQEVLCISIREIVDECIHSERYNEIAWQNTGDVMYSNFMDRNMYFDKMRYFVYEMLSENHANGKFGRLEFIFTLLVFAANDFPSGLAVPGRLYRLDSNCSENRLKELVSNYDQKLENTISEIEFKVREIEREIPGPMSDADAEREFQSGREIPVSLNPTFDMEGFFADSSVFGLSEDCPKEENVVWGNMYHKSDNVMHRYMKQPRRSLEKATEELRRNNKKESVKVIGLNHFQVDDIREFAENEEDEMVKIETKDFYDTERYEKRMKDGSDAVRSEIATRMTRKTTVILSCIVLLISVIGFIPVLFFNERVIAIPIPLLMTCAFLFIMVVAAFIMLRVFRKELQGKVEDYNDTMKGIKSDVEASMGDFSKLLTHAGCVMRSNYALTEAAKKDNVFKRRIRILKGHVEQIRDRQTGLREMFGEYLHEYPISDNGESYKYDFDKAVEYSYPVPFEGGVAEIDFIEEGNTVEVPFALISGIKMEMEGLYE